MNRVGIVDYGLCNLDSVARAVEECGAIPVVTDQPKELESVHRLILPGVGAFPDAMKNLRDRGLDQALRQQVLDRSIPLLGICLGMQLLATRGQEVQMTPGLDLIAGEVLRLQPNGEDFRIPHVAWNEAHRKKASPLFASIDDDKDFYFVHSYHLKPDNEEDVLARTPYGAGFVSAVQHGIVFGVQFHPEKSQKPGFQLLRNFLSIHS